MLEIFCRNIHTLYDSIIRSDHFVISSSFNTQIWCRIASFWLFEIHILLFSSLFVPINFLRQILTWLVQHYIEILNMENQKLSLGNDKRLKDRSVRDDFEFFYQGSISNSFNNL